MASNPILTRSLRDHYVAMARWCNRNALAYAERARPPVLAATALLNSGHADTYREMRDEYMERARSA